MGVYRKADSITIRKWNLFFQALTHKHGKNFLTKILSIQKGLKSERDFEAKYNRTYLALHTKGYSKAPASQKSNMKQGKSQKVHKFSRLCLEKFADDKGGGATSEAGIVKGFYKRKIGDLGMF